MNEWMRTVELRDKYRHHHDEYKKDVEKLKRKLYESCSSREDVEQCHRLVEKQIKQLMSCGCSKKGDCQVNGLSHCRKCKDKLLKKILNPAKDSGVLITYKKYTMFIGLKNMKIDVFEKDKMRIRLRI